ncbi:FAD-dependent oxidoreductase [Pseudooceanicola marinus]|uniref:FAD-dependent oxidoreductase n=1 Tax=Pseudooceanicola marinus TaxID=396013 RepID=UPI001CD38C80|nr:FAD-dependent oxidoreductase [Pseudooceanicola marinus]MCA1336803.1 FAD-dependent oxidoreductase [Pseudooceanicola marinus]
MSAKIAIVGGGPSGCYTAQALLKRAPDLEVDVIDALPVPYGLVRYGVAADHQGTKGVARQFARLFTRQKAQFFGNLRVGEDISLDELRAAYDAVVLATGLSADRPLGIPGEDLPGVIGAGALTRALYEHPDATDLPHLGATPLVIGTGNVAIDVLRLLAKTPAELHGSDLGAGPSDWLAAQGIERITVIGRSPAAAARFSPVMVKELGELSRADIQVRHPAPEAEDALNLAAAASSGPLPIEFRFETRPLALEAIERGLRLTVETPEGEERIDASSVISAIGFTCDGRLDRAGLLAEAEDGTASRLYAAGWFRGGPTGAIPQCREEGQALAARILEEITPDPARPGRTLFAGREGIVDFDHWQQIDAQELAAAPDDRCRRKFARREDLLRPALPQDA